MSVTTDRGVLTLVHLWGDGRPLAHHLQLIHVSEVFGSRRRAPVQSRSCCCYFLLKLSEPSRSAFSGRIPRWLRIVAAISLIAFPKLPPLCAQTPDLTQKSLEDLMNIEVTSVSKKE